MAARSPSASARFEVAGDAVEVGLRGQRPDLDVVACAGLADDHRGDLVDEQLGELVGHGLVDQHAAGGAALLAGVPVARGAQRGCGGGQVGVGEDDHRGLAAQFEVDALEGLGGGAGHRLAAADRSGERDHGDVGVFGEPGADHRAVAGHDVDDTGRQDVGHELGELQRGERGLLRRLDDQGVAGGQDGRHLPGGHQQRVVPRGHDPDDAQRLAQDDRQVVLGVVARGRGGGRAQRPGHEAERVDGLGHVVLRDRRRLAGVGRLQPREEVGVLGDAVGDAVQQLGALLGGQRGPTRGPRLPRRPPRRRCPRPCPRRPR